MNDTEAINQYRSNLIRYGRNYVSDNPDNLSQEEIEAVMAEIFRQLNEIDMSFGQPYHETGIRLPNGISELRQVQLFNEFVDWYQILSTPNQAVFQHVIKTFPVSQYSRILCVGDGENCHLGRKLAMKGYRVVSVDPRARLEFDWPKSNKPGRFKAIRANFYENSENMINWADLIVGSKIPPIVEDILKTDKPAVFSISSNPEIYNLKFRGVPITSEKQFIDQLRKCKGLKTLSTPIYDDRNAPFVIFEKEGRKQDKNDYGEIR